MVKPSNPWMNNQLTILWLNLHPAIRWRLWDGGFAGLVVLIIYEIVLSETSMPSFKSSPCIRGAPQSGFILAISMMSFLIFKSIGRLPQPLCLDLYLQNNLNPCLCHRITVSGFTIIKESCQPDPLSLL